MKANHYFYHVIFVCVVLVNSGLVQASPIGRLFSTAEERSYLDKLRKQNKFSETQFEQEDVQIMKLNDSHVVFNGIVQRSDKKNNEFWVNGKKVTDKKLVKQDNARSEVIAIKNADTQRYMKLKPGQKLDMNTGKIVEAYQPLSSATDLITHEVNR